MKKIIQTEYTAKDYELAAKRMADINDLIKKAEEEALYAQKKYQTQIDDLTHEFNTLLRAVKAGHEFREVELKQVSDYNTKKVYLMHEDQIVDERDMTESELNNAYEPEPEKTMLPTQQSTKREDMPLSKAQARTFGEVIKSHTL